VFTWNSIDPKMHKNTNLGFIEPSWEGSEKLRIQFTFFVVVNAKALIIAQSSKMF
jgi:hypothetical protein